MVPYPKMSPKGRTALQISPRGVKNAEEVAGDVRFCVAPQKMSENTKKQFFDRTFFAEKIFRRRKMKRRESSETRFGKVSCQSEPCSRGKRPFEVSKKN